MDALLTGYLLTGYLGENCESLQVARGWPVGVHAMVQVGSADFLHAHAGSCLLAGGVGLRWLRGRLPRSATHGNVRMRIRPSPQTPRIDALFTAPSGTATPAARHSVSIGRTCLRSGPYQRGISVTPGSPRTVMVASRAVAIPPPTEYRL